jgi:hypothetical protein
MIIRGADAREIVLVISSGLFDPDWYLEMNPDVKEAGVRPLEHFMTQGIKEGRSPGPVVSPPLGALALGQRYGDIAGGLLADVTLSAGAGATRENT